MPLKAFEIVDFGGVDSRSNPINMPQNRALRCLNWVPRQDGHLELRYGYSIETMSTVSATAIHTLFFYQSWDGTKKYLLYGQGTALKIHDLSTNLESTPAVRGAAIASTAKWASYNSNNRIHFGNGTDQKFFDGTTIRDNGLRAPTAAEIANVIIHEGMRQFTTTENSTITLTLAAGGSFPADTFAGRLIYVCMFDISTNEIGPCTQFAGTGRQMFALNNKITVANMPNLSAVPAEVKLIAGTADAGLNAYFFTNTSTVVTSCIRSGTTLTVISTAHGLSTNDVVILSGTTNFDSVYAITVVDVNTFTIAFNQSTGNNVTGANTTGGTCKRIVKAAAATTTVDVLAPTQDTSYLVNQARGLNISTVVSSSSGYQYYISIYNPVTGHVGNRLLVQGRFVSGTIGGQSYVVNVRFQGLPDYSGVDSEWQVIIGRTGDGALVPYACADNAGNFITAVSGQTAITVSANGINGGLELPTRNGIIPGQCTMFARVGDKCYAADPASPTIRMSGSEADSRQIQFLGRPEQSWAGDDIETFPTAEAVTGIEEVDYELFCGTKNDTAVLSDQNGQPVWRGPWNVGLAGPRAKIKAQPYGFFWLSGGKQLCTFVNGLPTPISEEYELAELAQIGDQFLGSVELVYFRDASINKDEIRIEGQRADGTPYTVIHDFKIRDARSSVGQGYSSQFLGPLATSFTAILGRDVNGKRTVYAGASTGQIYKLYSGANDAGTEYSADSIFLVNAGQERPDVPFLDWFGDSNVIVSIGKALNTSLDPAAQNQFSILNPSSGQPQSVPGSENDSMWRVFLDSPEIQSHLYLRFQLTSHSADGNLAFNSPPHVPLETYGRIYEIVPVVGESRGK